LWRHHSGLPAPCPAENSPSRFFLQTRSPNIYDLANQFNPSPSQADFTYSITAKTVKIQDSGRGKSVAEDLEAVLRKIEYWHQASIARYRISYWSTQGTEHMVESDGKTARVAKRLPLE
jgi:hypothetical protein